MHRSYQPFVAYMIIEPLNISIQNIIHFLQSREFLFLILYCCIAYPPERTLHRLPTLSSVCGLPWQIPFGQLSFLHHLRRSLDQPGLDSLVRQLRRYYTTVRLPMFVHYWMTSLDFPIHSSSTIALEEHGISRFSRELLMYMLGVSDLARPSDPLPYRYLKCCLPHLLRASAPHSFLTRLNTQPIHTVINASPMNLRTSVHDSSTVWGASPSLSETFIRKLTRRFIPAHQEHGI